MQVRVTKQVPISAEIKGRLLIGHGDDLEKPNGATMSHCLRKKKRAIYLPAPFWLLTLTGPSLSHGRQLHHDAWLRCLSPLPPASWEARASGSGGVNVGSVATTLLITEDSLGAMLKTGSVPRGGSGRTQ